jgi:hypothetical protein
MYRGRTRKALEPCVGQITLIVRTVRAAAALILHGELSIPSALRSSYLVVSFPLPAYIGQTGQAVVCWHVSVLHNAEYLKACAAMSI